MYSHLVRSKDEGTTSMGHYQFGLFCLEKRILFHSSLLLHLTYQSIQLFYIFHSSISVTPVEYHMYSTFQDIEYVRHAY